MEIVTGIEALDGLVAKVGGLNGVITGAAAVDSAAYMALLLGLQPNASLMVQRARPLFRNSEPVAVSSSLLSELGLADLAALKLAVAGTGFVHTDDVHVIDQHSTSGCSGEYKVRFRQMPGGGYEPYFVSALLFSLSGQEFRFLIVMPE